MFNSVHFGLIRSTSVRLVLFGPIPSTLVLFSPLWLFWSYSVHFGPFRLIWSFSVHYVQLGPHRSTWSYLVRLVLFGPYWSIWSYSSANWLLPWRALMRIAQFPPQEWLCSLLSQLLVPEILVPLGSQPLEQLKAKEFVAVCCVSIVEFYSEVHQLRAEVYSMGHILVVRFTKITGGISNHLSFDKVCLRRERVPTCSPH